LDRWPKVKLLGLLVLLLLASGCLILILVAGVLVYRVEQKRTE
jgi:hypothetical protein